MVHNDLIVDCYRVLMMVPDPIIFFISFVLGTLIKVLKKIILIYNIICMFLSILFLQIQELNPFSGNFQVFKQCGKIEAVRITKGNRLLIKLVSNDNFLTSKGIELTLRGKYNLLILWLYQQNKNNKLNYDEIKFCSIFSCKISYVKDSIYFDVLCVLCLK